MQTAAGIPKQDPQLIQGKLANGLTYFIRPNAEPKGRFSIRLRVNTGSLNETDDIQGVSHFLEHMVFNGSTHFLHWGSLNLVFCCSSGRRIGRK